MNTRTLQSVRAGALAPAVATCRVFLLCAFGWAVNTVCGQVSIVGVKDKTIYDTPVSFVVSNQPGYASEARLDGVTIAVGAQAREGRPDYHELRVLATNLSTQAVTERLVRFIVRAPGRAGTEDGLPPWTPYPLIPSAPGEFAQAQVRLIVPREFPQGLPIPVVAWAENSEGHAVRVNGSLTAAGQEPVCLMRGVGSGFLSWTNPAGTLKYEPKLGGLAVSRTITIEAATDWVGVSGTLAGTVAWPPNARIDVTNHLAVGAGSTLVIGAGAVVRVHPGIDITNNGTIVIEGSVDEPVVFTPVSPDRPWGGFLMWTGSGNLSATGAIFTGSGADADWFGSSGHPGSHRGEQALFFCAGASRVSLTDCAAISLSGQLGHAVDGGTFNLTRFLMQRATTGGEYSGATRPLRFEVNDSAFIECPLDSGAFADGDNDALYLVHGTHGFTNTLIGFTKDDGIDCGGSGAGVLHFVDCWFESTFHEGTALSGTGKQVYHLRNTLLNCGQGVEVAYDMPSGHVSQCLITANQTGARLGDNYSSGYVQEGFLTVTNSILVNNYRDVWGMSFLDWTYRSNQMDIRANLLTVPDARWAQNGVWSPLSDGSQLERYGRFPEGSTVGAGFALWTNRASLGDLTRGLPVRLSRFSSTAVKVRYTLESQTGSLASDVMEFLPGQTVKFISWPDTGLASEALLAVHLSAVANCEVTGLGLVFIETPAAEGVLIPKGATWRFLESGANLGTAWTAPAFSDAGWASGPAQLGFGDGDEATVISSNRQVTTYFRHTFDVADPGALAQLTVELLRDDGGVVYLNGSEVFRSNLPGGPIDFLTLSTNALDEDETYLFYAKAVDPGYLVPGTNVCAVEIHQSSATSSDLSFDLRLVGHPRVRPELRYARLGDHLVLQWGEGWSLEEAQAPNGPWMAVPGATSPHAPPVDAGARFFRLRQ